MAPQAEAIDPHGDMSLSDICDKAWQGVENKYGQVGKGFAVSAGVISI